MGRSACNDQQAAGEEEGVAVGDGRIPPLHVPHHPDNDPR